MVTQVAVDLFTPSRRLHYADYTVLSSAPDGTISHDPEGLYDHEVPIVMTDRDTRPHVQFGPRPRCHPRPTEIRRPQADATNMVTAPSEREPVHLERNPLAARLVERLAVGQDPVPPAVERDVVLRLADDRARPAADAALLVDDHSPVRTGRTRTDLPVCPRGVRERLDRREPSSIWPRRSRYLLVPADRTMPCSGEIETASRAADASAARKVHRGHDHQLEPRDVHIRTAPPADAARGEDQRPPETSRAPR